MKFMAIMKSDAAAEAGEMPEAQFMTDMDTFNQRMRDANVMIGGEGLHASSAGARLNFSSTGIDATPGPFPNPNELIAGFWMLECASLEAAMDWMKQCPTPTDPTMEIEIRRVFTEDDFAPSAS